MRSFKSLKSLSLRMLLPLLMLAAVGAPHHISLKIDGGGGKCIDYCPCIHVPPDGVCIPWLLAS